MDEIRRELENRRRISGIYTKTEEAFDSKQEYDSYLEAIEDIVYKLTNNIDVAEVEQQIQDYIRQEAAVAGAKADADGAAYVPPSVGAVLQPAPLVQVQQDAEGRLLPPSAAAPMNRQQWQQMAQASAWTEALVTRRALQDAFTAILVA